VTASHLDAGSDGPTFHRPQRSWTQVAISRLSGNPRWLATKPQLRLGTALTLAGGAGDQTHLHLPPPSGHGPDPTPNSPRGLPFLQQAFIECLLMSGSVLGPRPPRSWGLKGRGPGKNMEAQSHLPGAKHLPGDGVGRCQTGSHLQRWPQYEEGPLTTSPAGKWGWGDVPPYCPEHSKGSLWEQMGEAAPEPHPSTVWSPPLTPDHRIRSRGLAPPPPLTVWGNLPWPSPKSQCFWVTCPSGRDRVCPGQPCPSPLPFGLWHPRVALWSHYCSSQIIRARRLGWHRSPGTTGAAQEETPVLREWHSRAVIGRDGTEVPLKTGEGQGGGI
jgi:hypothetical protein